MANSMCQCCSDHCFNPSQTPESEENWSRIPSSRKEDKKLKKRNNNLEEELKKIKKENKEIKKIIDSFNLLQPNDDLLQRMNVDKVLMYKEKCSPLRDVILFYFKVTDKCNFKCEYCFQKDKKQISPQKMSDSEIVDNLKKSLLSISLVNEDINYGIMFAGGEPLLNMSLIKKTYEELNKIGLIKFWGISTNGKLISKNKSFLKKMDSIIINKCHYDKNIQKKYCGDYYDLKKDKLTPKIYNKISLMSILYDDVIKTSDEIKKYIDYHLKLGIKKYTFSQDAVNHFVKKDKHDYMFEIFKDIELDDDFENISIRKTNSCFCRKYLYKDCVVDIQGYLSTTKKLVGYKKLEDMYVNGDGCLVVNDYEQ